MADSDETKKSSPAWQKQQPTVEEPKEISRMEQAKRFLETEEVRNSNPRKQGVFLRAKGYTPEEIMELVGVNPDVIDEPPQSETSNPDPKTNPSSDKPPTLSANTSSQSPAQSRQEPQPPIITYPEFLTKPTAPSPLITSTRLLTTLTLFSSIYLLLHGSNKYILTPMQESLNRSRHELLAKASEHLLTLNKKLGDAVSEQPPSLRGEKEVETDDDESYGDPTEMFHRDIGIQTSPSLVNSSPSRPSSPSPDPKQSPIDSQLSRLSVLSSHLNEINSTSTGEGSDAAELTTTIHVLRDYLEHMAFTPPNYNFGASAYGGLLREMGGSEKEDPDEIAKLKASIRSVKGVLLSARSFPSTGRGIGSGVEMTGAH